jgi:hypothetical protein
MLLSNVSRYSKTPIYRASQGKGKRPVKLGDTVNLGMEKIDQNTTYLWSKMIGYVYICSCFPWIYMFYAEIVKKLLLVTFILGFESL